MKTVHTNFGPVLWEQLLLGEGGGCLPPKMVRVSSDHSQTFRLWLNHHTHGVVLDKRACGVVFDLMPTSDAWRKLSDVDGPSSWIQSLWRVFLKSRNDELADPVFQDPIFCFKKPALSVSALPPILTTESMFVIDMVDRQLQLHNGHSLVVQIEKVRPQLIGMNHLIHPEIIIVRTWRICCRHVSLLPVQFWNAGRKTSLI